MLLGCAWSGEAAALSEAQHGPTNTAGAALKVSFKRNAFNTPETWRTQGASQLEAAANKHPSSCCSYGEAHGVNARVNRPAVTGQSTVQLQSSAASPTKGAMMHAPEP